MFVMNRKRLSIMILVIFIGIFTFSYRTTEKEIERDEPVTATPVSNKTVILDAGHRKTR